MEDSMDHKDLETEMGFIYQQVLGKLIYAYIVYFLDIGYAVVLLSHFTTTPAKEHYMSLKGICKYLWHTKHWGLVYWQSSLIVNLPDIL